MATSIVRNINNAAIQVNAAAAAGLPAPAGSMTTEQGVSLYLEYTKTLENRVKVLEEESKKPKALQVRDLNREAHDLQEAYNALRVNIFPSAGIGLPVAVIGAAIHNLSGALHAAGVVAPIAPLKDVTFQRYDLAEHVLDNLGPRIAVLDHKEHVVPEFKRNLAWYNFWSTPPAAPQGPEPLVLPDPLGLRQQAAPPNHSVLWSLPPVLGLAAAPAYEYSFTTKPPPPSQHPSFTPRSSTNTTQPIGSTFQTGTQGTTDYVELAKAYSEDVIKLAKEFVTPTRALVWGATTVGTVWLAKKVSALLSGTPEKKSTLNPDNEVRYRLLDTMPGNVDKDITFAVGQLQEGYKHVFARFSKLEGQFGVAKKEPKTNYPVLYADLKVIKNETRSLKESIDELETTTRKYNKFDVALSNLDDMVNELLKRQDKLAKELSYDERNPSWSLWKSLTGVQKVGMAILPAAIAGMFAGDYMGKDPLMYGSALVYGSATLATLFGPRQSMSSKPSLTDSAKKIEKHLKEIPNGTLQPHFHQIRDIPKMLIAGNLKGAVDAYDAHVARVNKQVIKLHERAEERLFETSTLKVDLETLELEHHVLDEVYPQIQHQLMLEKKLDANFDKTNEAHRLWSDLKITFPKLRELIEKPKKMSHVKLTADPSKRPLSEEEATIPSISDDIRMVQGKLAGGKLIVPADDFKPLLSKLLQQSKDLKDNFGNEKLEKAVLKANLAVILNDYRELVQLGYSIEEKNSGFNQSNLQTLTELEAILLPLKTDITKTEPWFFSKTTKVAIPCMAIAGLTFKFNEELQKLTAPEAEYTPHVFGAIAATAVATKVLSWLPFSKTTKYAIPSMVALAAMSHYQNDKLQQLAQPHLMANTQYLQYTPHVLGGLAALTATVKVVNWVRSFWNKPEAADKSVEESDAPELPSKATVPTPTLTAAEIIEQARLERLASQPEKPATAKGRVEQLTSEFDRTNIKLLGLVKERKFSEASQTVVGILNKIEVLRNSDLPSVDRATLNTVVYYLQEYVTSQPHLQFNHSLVRCVPPAKPTTAARVTPTVTPTPAPVLKPMVTPSLETVVKPPTPTVASTPTQIRVKQFTGPVEAGKYLPSQTLSSTRSSSYTIRDAQVPIALMSVVSSLRDATGTLDRAGEYGATKHRNVLAAKPTTVSEQLRALSGVTEHVPTFTVEAPRIEGRDTIDFKAKLKEVDQLRQKSGKSQILVPIMMQDAGYVLSIEDKKGTKELVLSGVQPHPEVLGTKGHFRTKFTSIDEAANCLKQMNLELTKLGRGTSMDVSFHPCIPNQLIAAAG